MSKLENPKIKVYLRLRPRRGDSDGISKRTSSHNELASRSGIKQSSFRAEKETKSANKRRRPQKTFNKTVGNSPFYSHSALHSRAESPKNYSI